MSTGASAEAEDPAPQPEPPLLQDARERIARIEPRRLQTPALAKDAQNADMRFAPIGGRKAPATRGPMTHPAHSRRRIDPQRRVFMIEQQIEIATVDGSMPTFVVHPEGEGPFPLSWS